MPFVWWMSWSNAIRIRYRPKWTSQTQPRHKVQVCQVGQGSSKHVVKMTVWCSICNAIVIRPNSKYILLANYTICSFHALSASLCIQWRCQGIFIWRRAITQRVAPVPQKLKQFADIVYRFLQQKRSKFENLRKILNQCVSQWRLKPWLHAK